MIFLDTHAVVWLYQKELRRFSAAGLQRLEKDSLFVSSAVLLELDYLCEIGRISIGSGDLIGYLSERIGLETDGVSFLPVAEQARKLTWTRDPFDRLITAQAMFHNADLLTKDRVLTERYSQAFW